ncbi:hypothetical protein [Desulforhopalus singaporensis]|uniref:Uncharacterized protein n=1 Tax=Desulforhopalus singaporensis TaxID=91360 RepID=A0A1H0VWZ0_9BACT|nr:hypothetical protein [Desulforhopalus singaporensis]SDP82771.1 hypothetical protein SAMN05660330_04283 [Desulforhopalus singaporensis]
MKHNVTLTKTEFQKIMERLDRLEEKIDHQNDPGKQLSIAKKAQVMREALASGDKARIKAAKQLVG